MSSRKTLGEKLSESGLDLSDAAALGLVESGNAQESFDASFQSVAGFKIPYFNLDGTTTEFYRVRYLESPKGFAGLVAKPQRYAQPPGTLNEVYCPPFLGWEELAADTDQPILITEGELKAACACKRGWPTLALGGVSVSQSSGKGLDLLSPMDAVEWKTRSVYIVFDSDAAVNPNVAKAQVMLAKKLIRLGALPKVALLPSGLGGAKWGLDDFLVNGGDLNDVLKVARGLELGYRLADLNERYAYIEDQDVVVELQSHRRVKREAFINGLEAGNHAVEFYDKGKSKVISVPQEWMRWAARNSAPCITYAPGEPVVLESGELNSWGGWGVAPKAGSVEPWERLLEYFFESPGERQWFERWCAYPLQHPGTKLYTAVVIWSIERGTGKSLIGYTLGAIYGKNFIEVKQKELRSQFNEWAIRRQFVMGDEVTGSNKRDEADELKSMITQKSVNINAKFLPTYVVPDCINYYFNSNHPDAFFIDNQERRYFVVHGPEDKLPQEFYRHVYDPWLRGDGPAALFQHLLELDLGDFDPAAPAPSNAAKLEMVQLGRSDVADWVTSFLDDLELSIVLLADFLGIPKEGLDLVTNEHVLRLYERDRGEGRVTANGLGRELARSGVRALPQVRTSLGSRRFYILRNEVRWKKASMSDIKNYVDKYHGELRKEKF